MGADPQCHSVEISGPGMSRVTLSSRDCGSGEPVFVLLHGFMLDSSSWEPVMAELSSIGRVCAYDRLPFGRSEKLLPGDWQGPNPYTPEATLRQLEGYLNYVTDSPVVLIGNSAGGLLAARVALACPERVRALILVCPAIYGRASDKVARFLNSRIMNRLGPLIMRKAGNPDWLLRRSYCDPRRISAERFGQAQAMCQFPGWERALWEFVKVSTVQPDISAQLKALRAPVYIIGGSDDRVVPEQDLHRLAATLPDVKLELIAGAGHLPHEEQSDLFVQIVRNWLTERQIICRAADG